MPDLYGQCRCELCGHDYRPNSGGLKGVCLDCSDGLYGGKIAAVGKQREVAAMSRERDALYGKPRKRRGHRHA